MPKRNWTDSQRDAIMADSSPLLISAAAGSGKTAVLTERIARLLSDESSGALADRLLVVTFSNAAAGEMKERISKRLSELILEQPLNEHLCRQELRFKGAFVGTIHAFCLSLIRQNFQLLSVPPDVRIMDENELTTLRMRAISEELEERYSEGEPLFLETVELFSSAKNDSELYRTIIELYDFALSHPFWESWLDSKLIAYKSTDSLKNGSWANELLFAAKNEINLLLALTESAINGIRGDEALESAYLPAYLNDREALLRLNDILSNGDLSGAVECCRKISFIKLSSLRGYEDTDKKERIKALRQRVKDRLARLKKGLLSSTTEEAKEDIEALYPKIELLFKVVNGFAKRFSELKEDRLALDFSDLEQYAVKLLCVRDESGKLMRSSVAGELAERYDGVFIDEYQDVNDIQELIFSTISSEARLFMVGDVKQSIYSFRQAKPEIFIEKKESYPPYAGLLGAAKITLGHNFRSHGAVCRAINHIFSTCMSKAFGQVDYTEEEFLVPGGSFPNDSEAAVSLRLIDTLGAEEESSALEAEYVAAQIEELLKTGRVSDNGECRRVRCGDIAILLRSTKKKAEVFLNALKSHGIPVVSGRDTGFLSTLEISTAVSVLQAANNPLLDIPLVSAMMSPAFCMTATDIARIRLYKRGAPFYYAVLEGEKQGDKHCERLLSVTGKLRREAAGLSVRAVIELMYSLTGLIPIITALDSSEARVDNLRLLLEYADNYERAGYRTLSQFLGFLEELSESGKDLSPSASGDDGSVRVMSIHQSKGLEFPVVFLSDTAKLFNREDVTSSTAVHTDLGFACMLRDDNTLSRTTTLPLEAVRARIKRENSGEELRLLYVALTRAKEQLYITAATNKLKGKIDGVVSSLAGGKAMPDIADCFLDWLLMSAYLSGDEKVLTGFLNGEEVKEAAQSNILNTVILPYDSCLLGESAEKEISFTAESTEQLRENLNKALTNEYRFLGATVAPTKVAVTALTKQETDLVEVGLRFSMRPRFASREKLTAAMRGDAFHKYMLFADHESAVKRLEDEIERLLSQSFLSAEECEALPKADIIKFYKSALYKRILASNRVEREYRFMTRIPAAEIMPLSDGIGSAGLTGELITVQGICDLIFFENESLYIVDYKTDRVKDGAELLERYIGQITLYATILSKQLGVRIGGCIIYSTALGREITVPFTPQQ